MLLGRSVESDPGCSRLESCMLMRILCRIDSTPHYLIALLFRLKSRFDTSDPRLLILIQLSLKTRPPLNESFNPLPSVAQRRILIGTSEVVLRLLLIVVAFCASWGVRLFTSCLQIPVEGFDLEHISIRNCSFTLLRLPKPYSGFLSPFCRSNHLSWLVWTTEASARWRRSWRRTFRWTSVGDAWGEIDDFCSRRRSVIFCS